MAEQVNAALTEIAAKHPELTIELISSTVTYTESSYQLTIKTLLEGAFLTIVIVFFFLKSWRATTVAAVALPLSILPAFFVLALFDYSLNSITLLALTLVIGIWLMTRLWKSRISRNTLSAVSARILLHSKPLMLLVLRLLRSH